LHAVGVVVAAGVVVSLAHRYLTGDRQLRAPLAPPLLVAALTASVSAVGSAAGSGSRLYPILILAYQIGFCLWPVAFLAGALLWRPDRAAITDLLLEARGPHTLAGLRSVLAVALRDPSLRLGHWSEGTGEFIDTDGQRLDVRDGDGRVVALLGDPGSGTVRALARRSVPWEDARLVNAVVALAGLVLDNERLRADLSVRLVEVHASRARLVALADEERRRVERNLHDGAQQRLVTVALGIQLARQQLDHADPSTVDSLLAATADDVRAAIAELRRLARGIHPALLTEAGLVPAIGELVERTSLPVTLTVPEPLPRLPAPVEATAYFVVAEALTNALKYADASRAEVHIRLVGNRLRVAVVDDGVGGAEPVPGSGLYGLRDRVRALDGELTVRTVAGPGTGTEVIAEIPGG
jgi:signal transduction histidine kinase